MSWSPPERSPSSGQQHQFSAPAPPKSWNFNFKSKGKIIIVNQLWKASSRLKGSQNTSGVLQSHSPVCRISEELHVAVPTAHIECLIIKVRPVCLLWLLLSSDWWSPEAMGRYVNSPTRGRGGNSDGSSSVCACVCVCASCTKMHKLWSAPLPWCFPTEKGHISYRADGVRGTSAGTDSGNVWAQMLPCKYQSAHKVTRY